MRSQKQSSNQPSLFEWAKTASPAVVNATLQNLGAIAATPFALSEEVALPTLPSLAREEDEAPDLPDGWHSLRNAIGHYFSDQLVRTLASDILPPSGYKSQAWEATLRIQAERLKAFGNACDAECDDDIAALGATAKEAMNFIASRFHTFVSATCSPRADMAAFLADRLAVLANNFYLAPEGYSDTKWRKELTVSARDLVAFADTDRNPSISVSYGSSKKASTAMLWVAERLLDLRI